MRGSHVQNPRDSLMNENQPIIHKLNMLWARMSKSVIHPPTLFLYPKLKIEKKP